jgi:hypothetical protein
MNLSRSTISESFPLSPSNLKAVTRGAVTIPDSEEEEESDEGRPRILSRIEEGYLLGFSERRFYK